jgi:hypothetical protein
LLRTSGPLLSPGAGGDLLRAGGDAVYPMVLGCVLVGPASLLAGALCLFRFGSRAFGRGLLLGGSPCLLVALLYTAPLVLQGG